MYKAMLRATRQQWDLRTSSSKKRAAGNDKA
jgi:hypothetical protein